MKYNDLVSIAREFARNAVRLTMTSKVRDAVLANELASSECDDHLARVNHYIAVATYNLSKLDEKDPNFQKKSDNVNEEIKELNESIKDITEEKDCYTKKIASLNQEIVDIQDGKKKVSTETLSAISSTYLEVLNKDAMLKAAVNVTTEPTA